MVRKKVEIENKEEITKRKYTRKPKVEPVVEPIIEKKEDVVEYIEPQINEVIEEPKIEDKKRPNIFFFYAGLIMVFLIYNSINPFIYKTIAKAIIYGRYGEEIIYEAVCFFIVLIVTLLAGNKYIFTEKKKNFTNALGIGGVMFGLASILFIVNSSSILSSSSNDVLSLVIYCIFIGLFEEFLCRGWIQNELIERYSKNRGQAILSIVLSSLIFGGMHISNIWVGGQGVIETFSQIIQAVGMGIYLGAIYYRSKNIWCNVFLHGFWDFAILLGEINTIKLCSEGNASKSFIVSQLISSTVLATIYILLALYILRKSQLVDRFKFTNDEVLLSEKRKDRLVFMVIVLFFSISYIAKENDNQVCYNYESKEVVIKEKVTPVYNEYYFDDNNVKLKLYIENSKLKIKDLDSKYEKEVEIDNATNFIVVRNKDNYYILVRGLNEYMSDTVLYYSSFLKVSNIDNNQGYIDYFTNSFTKIDSAPRIKELGYLYSLSDDTTYPYIISSKNEMLLVYDKELYTVQQKNYETFIEGTK